MIIDEKLAMDLRALKESGSLQINGLSYKVISVEDLPFQRPSGKSEVMDEGMRWELKNNAGSFFSLMLADAEICYTLEGALDGPAPLNSNPDILFDQDGNKTLKYRISRRRKKKITLAFFEGENEVEINSLQLVRN